MDSTLAKIRRHCYRNSLSLTTLMVLSVISVAVSLSINFWALHRTFITCDEGIFMYYFAHDEVLSSSHGHLLFSWLPGLDGVYANRTVSYVLKVLAALLFCLGMNHWLKRKIGIRSSLVLLFGLVSLTNLYIVGCPSLNYTQLVHTTMMASLGILLYALTDGRWWQYVLGGFMLSFLFPIKATSMSIVPFVLAAIWIMTGWRNMLYCIAGGLLGLALLVFVIESPSQIYTWLSESIGNMNRVENYDYSGNTLTHWGVNAIKNYFKWGFTTWLIIMIYKNTGPWVKNRHQCAHNLVFGVLAIAVLCYTWLFLYPYAWTVSVGAFLRNLLWVTVMTATVCCWHQYRSMDLLVISLLLMLTPMCMSLGTNVAFIIRHIPVYITVILMAALLLHGNTGRWMRSVTVVMFLLSLGICASSPYVNWEGDRYADQHIPLSSIGLDQDILVDQKYIDRLEFYQQRVPKGADVIVSIESWSTAYLLDFNTLTYQYRQFNPELIKPKIDQSLMENGIVYVLFTTNEYDKGGSLMPISWREVLEELSQDQNINIDIEIGDIVGLAKITPNTGTDTSTDTVGMYDEQ